MQDFVAAVVQFTTCSRTKALDKREGLEKGLTLLETAAQQADLVVLPEFALVPYVIKEEMPYYADSIPGETTGAFGKVARAHRTFVVVGLPEKSQGKYYNSCVLIDRKGEIIAKHRKVHLYPPEAEFNKVIPGDTYQVHETELGKIGMMICYDAQFPEVGRILALKGAEIFLIPACGGAGPYGIDLDIANWKAMMVCNALWNSTFVVQANKIGYEPKQNEEGIIHSGHSLIVAPNGRIIAEGDLNERILYGELKAQELHKARPGYMISRRPELYQVISSHG